MPVEIHQLILRAKVCEPNSNESSNKNLNTRNASINSNNRTRQNEIQSQLSEMIKTSQ